MPIYEYKCTNCGKELEVMQKISAPAPDDCPECHHKNTFERLVSRTSFQLKGGGWYSDLYGSTKKPDANSTASTPAAKSEGDSTSTANAPAAAPASSTSTPSPAASSSGGSSSGGGSTGGGSTGSSGSST